MQQQSSSTEEKVTFNFSVEKIRRTDWQDDGGGFVDKGKSACIAICDIASDNREPDNINEGKKKLLLPPWEGRYASCRCSSSSDSTLWFNTPTDWIKPLQDKLEMNLLSVDSGANRKHCISCKESTSKSQLVLGIVFLFQLDIKV